MTSTVLIVDDRRGPRRALRNELADAGFRVVEAEDGSSGWDRFREAGPDLVLTDLVMPGSDGIELLTQIRASSEVPVVVFTAHGTVDSAVAAFKCGADEFVSSEQVDAADLVSLVEKRLVRSSERVHLGLARRLPGRSAAARRVRDRLAAVAPLAEPILVSGERGSGRADAARALHDLGPRAARPFLQLSCAAPAPPESRVDAGSVFLERADLVAPSSQEHWLNWLDCNPASEAPRLLASAAPVHAGLAGPLVARLKRFEVSLAPLRERPEDIPEMAELFLAELGARLGRPGRRLSEEAVSRLRLEPWPGNAAELSSVIEKLVAFTPDHLIGLYEVEEILAETRFSVAGLRDRRSAEEREDLVEALEATGGNVTRAAELLGRSRAAVYRMVEKHGVPLRRGG